MSSTVSQGLTSTATAMPVRSTTCTSTSACSSSAHPGAPLPLSVVLALGSMARANTHAQRPPVIIYIFLRWCVCACGLCFFINFFVIIHRGGRGRRTGDSLLSYLLESTFVLCVVAGVASGVFPICICIYNNCLLFFFWRRGRTEGSNKKDYTGVCCCLFVLFCCFSQSFCVQFSFCFVAPHLPGLFLSVGCNWHAVAVLNTRAKEREQLTCSRCILSGGELGRVEREKEKKKNAGW